MALLASVLDLLLSGGADLLPESAAIPLEFSISFDESPSKIMFTTAAHSCRHTSYAAFARKNCAASSASSHTSGW